MKKLIIILLFLSVLFTGCGETNTVSKQNESVPLSGEVPVGEARIGAMTGSTGEMFVEKNHPDAELSRYDSIPDAVLALQAGKLDYVITAYTNALGFVRNNKDLEVIPGALLDEGAAIAVRKTEAELLQNISSVLERFRADGTLDDIISRWIKEDGGAYGRKEIPVNLGGEVLTVGVAANREPMCFIENGKIVGLDCELIERIAYEMGMRVEYMDMQFSALIAALESGKVSVVISNVTATEERKLKVNFTEDYFQNPQVLLKAKGRMSEQVFRAEDFVGKNISVATGAIFDQYVLEFIPGAAPVYFNSSGDAIAALKTGKIDAMCDDDAALRKLCAQNPGFKILEPCVTQDDYAVVCAKENEYLLDKLNEFIALIKSDGTYDDMLGRWLDTAEPPTIPAIPEGSGETLRFGTSATSEGFSYYRDGEVTGFDVEFAKRFAAYMDMKLEISVMDFGGMLPAVQSRKIDFAANLITITEERKQSVSFTEPYYTGGAAICVYDAETLITPSFRAKDFTSKRIGILTGSTYDGIVDDYIGGVEKLYFQSLFEIAEAVKSGRVDAAIYAEPAARSLAAQHPDLLILYPAVTEESYGILFNNEDMELRAKFNEFLRDLKKSPVYGDMVSRWFDTADPPPMPDIPATGANGALKFATAAEDKPFSYVRDGEYAGFDVELAARFAAYMDMELEISLMSFDALFPTVQSGKADFAGNMITITDERALSFAFSDPYYVGGTVMIVRGGQENGTQKISFLDGLKKSFYQNLIVEDRWKLALEGLRVTIVISVFAMLLGTLLGFLLCFMALSRVRLLSIISKAYTALLRGTPIVVLLMIIFYIIFAKVHIDPVLVAIIAFGLNGGAFIGEIVRSAILTVDKGQVEAARSMGFSGVGAFFLVTLPQAARVALPVYKSEFVSMVKATAIVGYIAIMDLTKAGDIIRSRTYDAFFPLLAVAVVYLLTTGTFLWLFGLVEKMTDKRRRRKKI